MQIRTDRWHYKLYQFGTFTKRQMEAGSVSLCKYVRNSTIGVFFSVVLILIFAAAAAILTLGGNIVSIFLGIGTVMPKIPNEPEESLFRVSKKFSVPGTNGHWSLAWILGPLWALSFGGGLLWWGFATNPDATRIFLEVVGGLVVAIVAIIFAQVSYDEDGQFADALRVGRAYLKAKKEKVCPLVEFVEPTT